MYKNMIKEVCLYFWKELVFVLITTIYLFFLNALNHNLLKEYKEISLDMLFYKDGIPIYYFLMAVALCIAGVLLIHERIKMFKFGGYGNYTTNTLKDFIIDIIVIIVLLVFIGLIIYFINNPILRLMIMLISIIVFSSYK